MFGGVVFSLVLSCVVFFIIFFYLKCFQQLLISESLHEVVFVWLLVQVAKTAGK